MDNSKLSPEKQQKILFYVYFKIKNSPFSSLLPLQIYGIYFEFV